VQVFAIDAFPFFEFSEFGRAVHNLSPVDHRISHSLFSRAQKLIPGGVNSPVRAFRGVGGEPFFVERASGCRIRDVDGNAVH